MKDQNQLNPRICDCTHGVLYHDPVSGGCLRTNVVSGPCPCAATPAATRATLEAVHKLNKLYNADELSGIIYGRRETP